MRPLDGLSLGFAREHFRQPGVLLLGNYGRALRSRAHSDRSDIEWSWQAEVERADPLPTLVLLARQLGLGHLFETKHRPHFALGQVAQR